jgi:formylglycine-generating enzyme required for sulfatase activity
MNSRALKTHPKTLAAALLASVGILIALGAMARDDSPPPLNDDRIEALRADPQVRALMDKTLKNLRFIEGGSFQMGDFGHLTRESDDKFLHPVVLDSFSMSAYKTTYEDHDVYTTAMGLPKVGAQMSPTNRVRPPKAGAGVNWYQARDYCQWLGALLDLPMDLATEAQWEYAARNRGQNVAFATDTGEIDVGRNSWEYDQREAMMSSLTDTGYNLPTLPVGQFPPTPLGLYDMMTDGFEWVLDWYGENYYRESPVHNPRGPAKGPFKVLRASPSRDGEALSHGDGVTVLRNKREPIPPNVNSLDPELKSNKSYDTTARCVVNLPRPVGK